MKKNLLSYFSIDKSSPVPLYCQLIDGMRRLCREVPGGTRLPNECDICAEIGCSRNVLRQAFKVLTEEGNLERRRCAGTFIARKAAPRRMLVLFADQTASRLYWRPILSGVEAAAAEYGVELLKMELDFLRTGDPAEKRAVLEAMKLSGIILLEGFYCGNEAELELLSDLGIPVILPMGKDTDCEMTPFHVMFSNGRRCVCSAIKLLRSLGHRRIGAVSFEYAAIHGLSAREFSVFCCGSEEQKDMVLQCPPTDEEVEKCIKELLDRPEPPTAILCHSDFYAAKIFAVLKQFDLRIPEDISVMSIFAHPGSELLSPPLTTVSMQLEERGKAALRYLYQEEFSAAPAVPDHKILLRESITKPRQQTKEMCHAK